MKKTILIHHVFHIEDDGNPVLLQAFDNFDGLHEWMFENEDSGYQFFVSSVDVPVTEEIE